MNLIIFSYIGLFLATIYRIPQLIKIYKTKIMRYNPTKMKVNTFKNNKYLVFLEDYERNKELYRITDYFSQKCRVQCLLKVTTNKNQLEFFNDNKDKILKELKKRNEDNLLGDG